MAIEVDVDLASPAAAIEYCYEQGWTDGLPVVPPTEELVAAMIEAGGQAAELQLGAHLYRYEWFRVTGRPGESDRVGLVLRNTTDESRMQEKLVQAEKSAQANVIRRREETAATRSLLNTAKVMEDSPTALRLKELETLEKVTEKIDKISVFGGLDGVLKDLVKIR